MFSSKNSPLKKKTMNISSQQMRFRIIVWIITLLACGFFSFLTVHFVTHLEDNHKYAEGRYVVDSYWRPEWDMIELKRDQTLEQRYTAMGQVVGDCKEIYLDVARSEKAAGTIAVELYSEDKKEAVAYVEKELQELPQQGTAIFKLPKTIITNSGEHYILRITNLSKRAKVSIRVDPTLLSGELLHDGTKVPATLMFKFLRRSNYEPSSLFYILLLVTNVTILGGLALVLFTKIKEHTLYMILALGFGVVTLFSLTSLYGHDMRFQFDSAYVLSNKLLGVEGEMMAPSLKDPEQSSIFYYRRTCDDYLQIQLFSNSTVSDNYVDVYNSWKNFTATEAEKELMLVETEQGFISDQLYLYLPQALGFTIARLLGLGFLPMLMLGRIMSYLVFVLLVYISIKSVPFGRRLLLIFALSPAVLTQTVSVTRDAGIYCLSFLLITKVLQVAYEKEKMPSFWDWFVILAVSAVLAPCKMVYLPLAFFWLLIIYRKYIYGKSVNWGHIFLRVVLYTVPILAFFVLTNLSSISSISQSQGTSLYGTESYSLDVMLSDIPRVLFVLGNTYRMDIGNYLVEAIQLWDVSLGSTDMITIVVIVLLLIESCYASKRRKQILPIERGFFFVITTGVLLLVTMASLKWTPVSSDVVLGLQGRYLTPMLPLLCLTVANNNVIRITGNPKMFINGCCCIFPAVYLMNMYLWTVLL